MEKIKSFFKKNWIMLSSCFVTFLILMICFIFSGNWPFGTRTLATFDLSAQVVPLSHLIKDIFQGKATLFYTNRLAGGFSVFATFVYFAMSPFIIILAICPRADAYLWVNLVFVLYLVSISLSMSYTLNKLFPKLNSIIKILLAVCYSFCGYILLNYTFIVWLNFLILMPLMVLAFKRMIESGKYLLFSTLTFFYIISCFGVGAMSQCLFLVIYYLFIILCVPKEKRKETLVRLTLALFVGVSFSLLIVIPALLESLNTNRTTDIFQYIMRSNIHNSWEEKSFFVLIDAVTTVFTLFYVITCKKKDRLNIFIILTLVAVYLLLLIDVATMLFNFGVYFSYSTRASSLLNCVSILVLAKFINDKTNKNELVENKSPPPQDNVIESDNIEIVTESNLKSDNVKQEKPTNNKHYKEKIIKYVCISLIVLMIGFVLFFIIDNFKEIKDLSSIVSHNKVKEELHQIILTIFTIIMIITAIGLFFYFRKFISKNVLKIFTIGLLCCQIVLSVAVVSSFSYNSNGWTTRNKLLDICEPYDRVMDYSKNSTMYNDVSGLGIFTSTLHNNNVLTLSYLGNSVASNTVGHDGGNLFTQSLMGIDYVYSTYVKKGSYYSLANTEKYSSGKKIYLYSYKYSTTGAFVVDDLYDWDEEISPYENYNNLAKTMGATKNIFKVYNLSQSQSQLGNNINISRSNLERSDESGKWTTIQDKKAGVVNCSFSFSEPTIVYVSVKNSGSQNIFAANVTFNKNYGIGSGYCNEVYNNDAKSDTKHISFKVRAGKEVNLEDFSIGVLNLKTYAEQFKLIKQNEVEVEYVADGFNVKTDVMSGKSLLVSNVYYDSFKAKINGKNSKVYSAGPNLIGVNLYAGTNNVKVRFHYPYLWPSLLISGVFIAMSIVLINLYKKKHKMFNWLEKYISPVFMVYCIAFAIIFYVIPCGITITKL